MTGQASLFDPPAGTGPVAPPAEPVRRDWNALNRGLARLKPAAAPAEAWACLGCGEIVNPASCFVVVPLTGRGAAVLHGDCHPPWWAGRVAEGWKAVSG